ncbi:MAG: Mur ligase [bacterium]|nr:Mur ligase [bacterium]
MTDSRRLTGPNLIWDLPGAVLEVQLAEGQAAADVVITWQAQVSLVLESLGLAVQLTQREYPGGVSLAFAAPIDTLYTAMEINEWAFESARRVLAGEPASDLALDLDRLSSELAKERDPRLLALAQAAADHHVNFCGDDEWTTVGMGAKGKTWDTPELPQVSEVDWSQLADIPSVIITGTNGKTTTVRLMGSIVRAAGLTPGTSSTDWIQVGDELLDSGDWSGPGGARAILKDTRVDVALLETARGGMLRRGLGVNRVDVSIVTNVAEDHMGDMGVHCLEDLTEVKFIVEHAGEHLVLNADNPEVRRRGQDTKKPITWVSLDPNDPFVTEHLGNDGRAALLCDGSLVIQEGQASHVLLPAEDIPITLGGAARYNITNALCAAAAALQMGLPMEAVRQGLGTFESNPDTNPGRLNLFDFNGVTALVDFAHNPHGLRATMEMVAGMKFERFAVLLGQAGDRDDDSIEELARITAKAAPDLAIIKTMDQVSRGRSQSIVTDMIEQTMLASGVPQERIQHAASELQAARNALTWCKRGDLLLLLCHSERGAVLDMLNSLEADGWRPGNALPA